MSTSAVAGASTVYVTVNQAQNVDTPEVTLNTDSLQVEKCLRYKNKIQTILRNTGTKPVNISQATILINDQVKNNFKVLKNQVIKPDQTTKIQFKETQEIQTYKITQPQTGQTKEVCNIIQQPNGQAPTPINQIPEGGGQTQTLAYGTTGSVSIIPPNPKEFGNPDTFCIGDQCQESTGNQPVDTPETPGDYVNRYYGAVNGTIEVTNRLQVSDDEDLCIGSECGNKRGDANKTELYGQDGRMDGPIEYTSSSNVKRGLVLDESVCIGSC